MRWRRLVDEALAPLRMTLTQWLVLEATLALTRELRDAVSQKQISERTGFDKVTVSQRMQTLERNGYVDRAPDIIWPAWRVRVTDKGVLALEDARDLVDAVSARLRQSSERAAASSAPRRSSLRDDRGEY
jgi:DNA-binding MarR family transcriptional regulator